MHSAKPEKKYYLNSLTCHVKLFSSVKGNGVVSSHLLAHLSPTAASELMLPGDILAPLVVYRIGPVCVMLTFPLDHALVRVDKLCKSLQSSSEEPTEGTQLYHTWLITSTVAPGCVQKRLPIRGQIHQRLARAAKLAKVGFGMHAIRTHDMFVTPW